MSVILDLQSDLELEDQMSQPPSDPPLGVSTRIDRSSTKILLDILTGAETRAEIEKKRMLGACVALEKDAGAESFCSDILGGAAENFCYDLLKKCWSCERHVCLSCFDG